MKVFISWSGERSNYVARVLFDWIGQVNQLVEPWLSEEMPKGVRWSPEIAKALDETRFGIFCVTPENQSEPWLNFEAGALSKTVKEKGHVCPYLIDLKPTDVVGPLKEFQLTKTDEEDTLRLIRSMNQALGEQALPEEKIKASFKKWWPDLEKALREIPPPKSVIPKTRDPKDIQEETLEIVRRIDGTLSTIRKETGWSTTTPTVSTISSPGVSFAFDTSSGTFIPFATSYVTSKSLAESTDSATAKEKDGGKKEKK